MNTNAPRVHLVAQQVPECTIDSMDKPNNWIVTTNSVISHCTKYKPVTNVPFTGFEILNNLQISNCHACLWSHAHSHLFQNRVVFHIREVVLIHEDSYILTNFNLTYVVVQLTHNISNIGGHVTMLPATTKCSYFVVFYKNWSITVYKPIWPFPCISYTTDSVLKCHFHFSLIL